MSSIKLTLSKVAVPVFWIIKVYSTSKLPSTPLDAFEILLMDLATLIEGIGGIGVGSFGPPVSPGSSGFVPVGSFPLSELSCTVFPSGTSPLTLALLVCGLSILRLITSMVTSTTTTSPGNITPVLLLNILSPLN